MPNLSSRSPLPDQRVLVSVAEPWDFESEAGPNRFEARFVADETTPGSGAGWVIEVPAHMKAGGVTGRFLVMRPRYQKEPLEALLAGEKVHVNLGLIPEGGDWGSRLSEAIFVIAGTATLSAAASAPS